LKKIASNFDLVFLGTLPLPRTTLIRIAMVLLGGDTTSISNCLPALALHCSIPSRSPPLWWLHQEVKLNFRRVVDVGRQQAADTRSSPINVRTIGKQAAIVCTSSSITAAALESSTLPFVLRRKVMMMMMLVTVIF
jgi:hypothetical protein